MKKTFTILMAMVVVVLTVIMYRSYKSNRGKQWTPETLQLEAEILDYFETPNECSPDCPLYNVRHPQHEHIEGTWGMIRIPPDDWDVEKEDTGNPIEE